MYQYGEVFTGPELKPWALKHDRDMLNCSVKEANARTIDGVTYFAQVINETENLNECHLMVATSTIQGAGYGLFIRPQSHHGERHVVMLSSCLPLLRRRASAKLWSVSDLDSTR